jgi:hypothetical protein
LDDNLLVRVGLQWGNGLLASKNGSDKSFKRHTECARGAQPFLLIVGLHMLSESVQGPRMRIRVPIQLVTRLIAPQCYQLIFL